MGCSWWSFATKSSNYDNLVAIDNKPATLLIPEFAISWTNNQSKLAIKHAGDYADFYMKEPYDNGAQINGHLLIAVFELLKQELEEITNTLPTFEECFYSNDSFPFENQTLEKLRRNGIDIELGTPFEDLLDYGAYEKTIRENIDDLPHDFKLTTITIGQIMIIKQVLASILEQCNKHTVFEIVGNVADNNNVRDAYNSNSKEIVIDIK